MTIPLTPQPLVSGCFVWQPISLLVAELRKNTACFLQNWLENYVTYRYSSLIFFRQKSEKLIPQAVSASGELVDPMFPNYIEQSDIEPADTKINFTFPEWVKKALNEQLEKSPAALLVVLEKGNLLVETEDFVYSAYAVKVKGHSGIIDRTKMKKVKPRMTMPSVYCRKKNRIYYEPINFTKGFFAEESILS